MSRRRGCRIIGCAALTSALITALPSGARADAFPALLEPGAFGSFSVSDERIEHSDRDGACPAGRDERAGAAAYMLETAHRSTLRVEIVDHRSVCEVSLHAGSLTDPFAEAERDDTRLARSGCAASCALDRSLGPGRFVVVIWSVVADGGSRARFSMQGSLRRLVDVSLGVSGHRIRNRCTGTYEVVAGRTIEVRARPAVPAHGRVRWHRRDGGAWVLEREATRALDSGTAIARALRPGRWRVSVDVLDGDQVAPGNVARARFDALAINGRRLAGGGLRLHVRYQRQQHRLSCEAAALRTAHNYFHPGRIDADMAVYRRTGHEARRRPNRRGGCNPDRAFCGAVDGRMMASGYGVHAGPIARAATTYDACRPALHLRGYRLSTLASHIGNGHPVIVWGAHAGATGIYRYTWRAWDGHRVTAFSVEHVWTVIGYRGPAARPTHFLIHDPSGEKDHTVSRARFNRFTRFFETAVVVRG